MADVESHSFLSELGSDSAWSLLSWVASLLMVFGGAAPYIPQYRDIQKSGSAEGFSTHVCLVMLVANILRLFFWFGKHFELTLLWQSIVLIITMLALLHLCCTVQSSSRMSTSRHLFTDFDPRYFWAWSRFLDYIQFCLTFTALCLLITYLLIDSEFYVESLGFSAVLIEAMLGMPQLLQNFRNKSTAGMRLCSSLTQLHDLLGHLRRQLRVDPESHVLQTRVKMVLLWTLGDIFKTTYFIINATPVQFWICGTVQICIDIAIFFQVFIYGQGDHEKYM
ncbi:solute carrier family 66 member 2 isoform X1 [Hemiscyllium ocellatum]|uniref:solute carrier family 66 member 2 isoform X1 n=1 Tax=Hemiscyllium ocellatum TaxID=170820 RepID=UPI002966691A|nr:solute carrier family 66 member 2 isoform X1 [Hemiscyllium ocellatum]XP_060693968.1 solute carrier family 66 member 2 isoform X1 [Hemiscyllium ocellatum]XP_060693969.1 solute carrier family 66 member 2 isoform X1 [Hemiscyllium ocellatum]XP_060693970.1 solute carrier family 66 member 2 isoform X1 [Hemiscyllium ocellatum]